MENLVLIGAGGHCKSTISVLSDLSQQYKILGILDKTNNKTLLGFPILGNDDLIKTYSGNCSFLITIGSIKDTSIRERIYNEITRSNGKLATVIAKSAVVSKYSKIGLGTVVYNLSHINADSIIGNNCIINSLSNIEHDCIIGDFVHISTGVMINGNCTVGARCFLGSNSVIKNGLTICDDVIIGAGAVVLKDITEPGTYIGNPLIKI